MKKVILGFDGGATKTHLVIFGEDGYCMGSEVYGPLNHEVLEGSYTELEERLSELIPRVVNNVGADINDVAFAVFGLAGVDTDAQHTLISGMFDKIGIKNHITCNDAFLGVPAGCPDCVGICAINGTGFKLAAIDNSGTAVQTCGLGSFTDDYGGGNWYGLRAVGSVYNELYKLGKPTMMREMIFDMLGVTRREDYMEIFTEKYYDDKLDILALNCVPFDAAAFGDEVALRILEDSAEQYAGAIARLIMDLDFPESKSVHVTFAGSVFVRQQTNILHERIMNLVDTALGGRPVEYNRLDAPPVAGAVIWAAQKAGIDIEIKSIKNCLAKAGL